MPTERVFLQRRLHFGRQAIEAGAHVGGAGGKPDLGAGGQADHRSTRSNTCANMAALGCPSIRTRTSPNSSTTMPSALMLLGAGADGASTTGNRPSFRIDAGTPRRPC